MKIRIKEKPDLSIENNWFEDILKSLDDLDCEIYVGQITELNQAQQKAKIQGLQQFLFTILKTQRPDFNWKLEHQVSEKRDSIDIYGDRDNYIVIIELDKWRADQVAKKLISRTALLIDKKIGFISLCYGGTEKMNKSECLKYFKYGKTIMFKLDNYYAGLIIE